MQGLFRMGRPITVSETPAPEPGSEPSANDYAVSPGYFDAQGAPLQRGRAFTDADRLDAPPVMLVSVAFAAMFFPGADAIGQRVNVGNGRDAWYEIVGVVGDVRQYGLDQEVSAQMYVPFAQDPFRGVRLVARVAGDPATYAKAITEAVRKVDPDQPVGQIATLDSIVADSLASEGFSALLILAFAATALLLAAVGFYGTVAYSVSQATQEIGVRMALGAQGRDLLAQVLGSGVRLALAGLAVGVVLALALGRTIEGFLFGVQAYDPAVIAGVALLLLGVAAVAALVPALRASRTDPMVALRHE